MTILFRGDIFKALIYLNFGAVAQLGEHLHGMQGVRSSILLSSTKNLRQVNFLWHSSERDEVTSRAARGVPKPLKFRQVILRYAQDFARSKFIVLKLLSDTKVSVKQPDKRPKKVPLRSA